MLLSSGFFQRLHHKKKMGMEQSIFGVIFGYKKGCKLGQIRIRTALPVTCLMLLTQVNRLWVNPRW